MANEDNNDKQTLLGKAKESSLKAAGYSYLVGDAALFASGIMAGRSKEASSGLLYGMAGLICAKYGDPNADQHFKLLTHKLGNYLKQDGIAIPHTPQTAMLAKDGGIIDHVETFLYTYPSQILNAFFTVGGVQLLRSGLQHKKGWDTASGACVAAGALAGLLIPEKKPDPDHPALGPLGKAWEWVQEKPLRLSGALYTINNVTLTASAMQEMRKNPNQKSYLFKFLTAASYVFANAMLSISSKSHGDSGEMREASKAMEKLADAAARVIAAQPPELQAALLENIAGHLSDQPGVGMNAQQISKLLQEKLASVKNEAALPKWQQHVLAPSPGDTPSL